MKRVSSTKGRRWGAFMAAAVLSSLVFPLSGVALANHGDRVLDVEPETFTRGVGTTHTMTATLCDYQFDEGPPPSESCPAEPATFSTGPINIDFENEGGPNDTDGTTRLTPDLTCSIPAGSSSCQVSYVGMAAGTDTWRAWIDHDDDNNTDDSDSDEPRNEANENNVQNPDTDTTCNGRGTPITGSENGEPDCTDVVSVTWTVGAPTTLDCDDETGPDKESEINPAGGASGNETYTCQARDQQGNATGDYDANTNGTQDLWVYGEVENGVNDPDSEDGASYESPDYSCRTGAGRGGGDPAVGQCTITVTQGELEEGTAEICFWADDSTPTEGAALCADEPTYEDPQDTGDQLAGNDPADQVEKTWEARTSGEGKGAVDAEPEADVNPVGANHQITATVYDQFGQSFNGNTTVYFEWFAGSAADQANEGGDGNSPQSPDDQCTTNNTSACSITYTSSRAGRDLICVWTNDTPTMSGTNQNGTCNGEGLNDPEDAAGPDFSSRGDDVDVVSKTWQNDPPADRLDCEPESGTAQRDETHSITCTATRAGEGDTRVGVQNTHIDIEATGANDPDGGNTPLSPDFSCTTDADGQCTIVHNPTGDAKGTTTYRAWIDSDDYNETNESDDTEVRDEGAEDPDSTDVVQNTWTHDSDREITLKSNRLSREAGKTVKLSGRIINADPECTGGETVRLRRRPPDSGRWQTIDNTLTDEDGRYEFIVTVRNTRDYKTVAPRTPEPCDKATSPVIGVEAT